MKGFLKGLRYISRIFEDEKEPEMQIGKPTDVKHVAHIGWEGPSATTPSWMHDYKSPAAESKGSSNKKPASSGERQRNKGRRKSSTSTNSPSESPARAGGSVRPSRRNNGKQRELAAGSESESVEPKQSRQRKSKVSNAGGGSNETQPSASQEKSKETDTSVGAVYPFASLGR